MLEGGSRLIADALDRAAGPWELAIVSGAGVAGYVIDAMLDPFTSFEPGIVAGLCMGAGLAAKKAFDGLRSTIADRRSRRVLLGDAEKLRDIFEDDGQPYFVERIERLLQTKGFISDVDFAARVRQVLDEYHGDKSPEGAEDKVKGQ